MAVADPHAALTAYLLGELDDERRREFEAHLEGCAACRADVAELEPTIEHGRAALPGTGGAPSDIAESTLARIDPRSRRTTARASGSRRTSMLAIAGVLAALLIAAIFVIVGGGEKEEPSEDAGQAPPATAPELRAELTGSAGSAMIEIDQVESGRSITISSGELPALGEGQFYELWLVSDNETAKRPARVSAGSFRPSEDGETEATLTVGVAPARFDGIEVTRERDRLPDAGGDTVLRLEDKGLIQLG
ncbi:anti-sigma factor [Thermoleophilia bacterium SCSIO 60948]|nr:anti-sigma factor [Thermoleophilia bacterium SCSIO 60948]